MITNTGNVVDDFNLTPGDHTLTTTLSNSHVHLAPSASANITVTAAIPPEVADKETDSVTVTATSQRDINKIDSAVLTTVSLGKSIKIYLPLVLLNSAR